MSSAVRAGVAVVIWLLTFIVVATALTLVLATFAGTAVTTRLDVITVTINAVPTVVASFVATRWPRPVTAERWVLIAGPIALGLAALVTAATDAVVWAQVVGNVLGLVATMALVRSAQAAPSGRHTSPDGG